jgi:hypothetical protein
MEEEHYEDSRFSNDGGLVVASVSWIQGRKRIEYYSLKRNYFWTRIESPFCFAWHKKEKEHIIQLQIISSRVFKTTGKISEGTY